MFRFLEVTSPASDTTFLTQAERRAAVGLAPTDNTQDLILADLDARVAARICAACNIAVGSGANPTLRQETLTETIRGFCGGGDIRLSRRHNVAVTSVTGDGSAVGTADYLVDPESGVLTALKDDEYYTWSARKLIIVYVAGFTTPPPELKAAASDFLRAIWLERTRDPFVKSEDIKIEGVEETSRSYWIGDVPGQSYTGAIPDSIAGQLTRFRNFHI